MCRRSQIGRSELFLFPLSSFSPLLPLSFSLLLLCAVCVCVSVSVSYRKRKPQTANRKPQTETANRKSFSKKQEVYMSTHMYMYLLV